MKRTFGQQGFSAGIVVVMLLVVTGLVLGGFFVWQGNKQGKQTNASTQDQNESATPSNDAKKEVKYLVIKEWGVKIPLNDDISGAYYTFNSDDLGESISLYDAAFDRMKNANGESCGGQNAHLFYAITRATPENAALDEYNPPYRTFPFTDKYVFSGLGSHQAPPYCASLNTDPYSEFRADEHILDIANIKERAFDDAFEHLTDRIN